jgi:hypothetical protein
MKKLINLLGAGPAIVVILVVPVILVMLAVWVFTGIEPPNRADYNRCVERSSQAFAAARAARLSNPALDPRYIYNRFDLEIICMHHLEWRFHRTLLGIQPPKPRDYYQCVVAVNRVYPEAVSTCQRHLEWRWDPHW